MMSIHDPLAQIDLKQLWIFTKIAECSNLTEASKVLGIEKTRLSRMLSDFENKMGVNLIHRTTRQFHLSDKGRTLYEQCVPALENLKISINNFLNTDGELKGVIRITGAHGAFEKLISPIIIEFSKKYPLITFDVVFSQQHVDLIKDRIDLAVRMGRPKDSSLKMVKIHELGMIFAATPSYLKQFESLELERLNEYKLLLLETMNNISITMFNGTIENHVKIKSTMTANSPSILLEMAKNNMGIGFLPEIMIKDQLKHGELIQVFPEWKIPLTPVCLIFGHQKQTPAHVRAFADFLIEALRQN